ncbi:MvdC/MvdD family ATP grasp protein [Yinghuangia sp. YIM S10712]|uniref:MvdC/MvdD family ATP grasp protein n=1 Tax=Yinghuangia sp. YIM S10712 TaxID=3436930 RepID=UPI003F53BBBC
MPDRPRILVATGPIDATADLVIDELNRRRVPLARIDVGAFPDSVTLSARLGTSGWIGEIDNGSRALRLEELRAVYWRRPSAYAAETAAPGPVREFASREARAGMGGVLYALPDVTWMNHPHAITACTKPAQLAAFARAGLLVPDTWIGNEPKDHGAFCAEGSAVSKTLGPIAYDGPDGYRVLFTGRVPHEHFGDVRAQATANHLQREIADKVAEYRVAAVGERLFISEAHTASPYLDIRALDPESVTYKPGTLPDSVQEAIRTVTREFGLLFAAWDLLRDAEGTVWALELNPAGQWAFTPDSDEIMRAIADHLEEAASQ